MSRGRDSPETLETRKMGQALRDVFVSELCGLRRTETYLAATNPEASSHAVPISLTNTGCFLQPGDLRTLT